MMLDLVKVERKRNNYIYILITVFIILLFSLFAIIYTNKIKNEDEEKEKIIFAKQNYFHKLVVVQDKEFTDNSKENIKNIYKSDEKRVFLTFDDGPSKTVTPLILDLLKEQNIKATFFVLGSRVEFYPEIVKREYEEGHYIGNHGYSHKYSNIYSCTQAVLDEYNSTQNAIRNALGDQTFEGHLFRFPGGSKGGKYNDIKQEAISLLESNNISYMDWNALSGDAEGKKTKEEMLEYAKQTIGDKQSVVILMHDAGDKILTYEILPDLINYLKEKGYSFKNIYDIL